MLSSYTNAPYFQNAPGRNRTCDRAVIGRVLLPTELQAQNWDARIRTLTGSFKGYRPAS